MISHLAFASIFQFEFIFVCGRIKYYNFIFPM